MTKITAYSTGECQVMTDLLCISNRADTYNIKYYSTVKSTRISDPLITINERQYLTIK
jgi:hypothetical protein